MFEMVFQACAALVKRKLPSVLWTNQYTLINDSLFIFLAHKPARVDRLVLAISRQLQF